MNEQPTALRIADALDNEDQMMSSKDIFEAAAELRRLHEAAERQLDAIQKLWKQRDTMEAALRQALEALIWESIGLKTPPVITRKAITAAKKALREKK